MALALLGLDWSPQTATAAFSDTAAVANNAFTADTLNAPTGLGASVSGTSVTVTWTATIDTYAAGHRVFRSATSGSGYAQIAEVTPRTTTSYVDTPGTGTWYYVVRAYYQNWESGNSNEASATVSLTASRFAGAGASEGLWELAWLNPANITANDDTDTNVKLCFDNDELVQQLRSSSYGFTIPGSATIVGIEVQIEVRDDSAGGGVAVTDQQARLAKAAIPVGVDKSNGSAWPTTRTLRTYGGPADLWGTTWTPAEVNAPGFGFVLRSGTSGHCDNSKVDYHRIFITYTLP